jgi:lysine 6-dehydrogenase
MKIVVLGGAGMMGCIAVKDLSRSTGVDRVVIADLDVERAKEVAALIGSPKVSVAQADATDEASLLKVLEGADCLLNATVYYFNLQVMEACLKAQVHYTDLGGLWHVTRQQQKLDERFKEAGITAVLGVGSAPGVPNVQSRYIADRLDTMEYIRIYDGIKPPPGDDIRLGYAIPTIIDEITMKPMVYRDGQFVACEPLSEVEDYWFTPPVGLLRCHLSLHSETATLPLTFAHKGVQECFFKINFWGMSEAALRKVKLLGDLGFASKEPIQVAGGRVAPRDVLIKMLAPYTPPISAFLDWPEPDDNWTKEIVTEVKGTRDGKTVVYRLGTLTNFGSLPTGVGPSVVAQWLASRRIEQTGVLPPEVAIEPEPFFRELEERGIRTQVTVTEPV